MPTIQIDNDVMKALEKCAIERGLVFGSPNDVLRQILGIDDIEVFVSEQGWHSDSDTSSAEPLVPSPMRQRRRRRNTASGSVLLRDHIASGKIDPSIKRGLYHLNGRNFAQSQEYPVVFFDPEGYIIINSEEEIRNAPDIDVGANVMIRNGIDKMDGYVRCGHSHLK